MFQTYRRFSSLIAAVAVSLGCAAMSEPPQATPAPDIIVEPLLSDAVAKAEIIARVRIVRRRTAHQYVSLLTTSCGHIYDVQIVDSIKGSAEPVSFFALTDDYFREHEDEDALVFLYRRPSAEVAAATNLLRTALDDETLGKISCIIAQPLFVPVPYENVWFFDEDAAAKFTGEWILRPARPDVGWCFGYGKEKGIRDDLIKSMSSGNTVKTVINWEKAKNLIEEVIKTQETPSC